MKVKVLWEYFMAMIGPVYYKPLAADGLSPLPLQMMPIDTPCFGRFVEIGMIEDRIPEETTTLNFRHLTEAHQIAVQNLASINQSLSERV